MLSHWCFFCSPWMHSCVKHEVSVWIRREWWWKSGRQGEKSGSKRGGKGKREKVVLGKVLFGFVWLCLPLPFSPAPTTPQHTFTLTHNPLWHMTHWCTPSHANRAVCCAAFFWEWTARHTLHHPHPTLHHLTSHNTHQQTQHRHSSWRRQQDDNCQWEWDWTKGQKWDNTAAPTHWLKWQQHNGFETHWTVADHWGMGWCGWHWQWQSVWHQAITLTSTSSNHQIPALSSLFTLKLKSPAFHPFHNTPHLSPFAHCVRVTLPEPLFIR